METGEEQIERAAKVLESEASLVDSTAKTLEGGAYQTSSGRFWDHCQGIANQQAGNTAGNRVYSDEE